MRAQTRTQVPADERDRIRAARDLDLLAKRPEPDLDAVVALTASICGTPLARSTSSCTGRVRPPSLSSTCIPGGCM